MKAELSVKTDSRNQLVDITSRVEEFIGDNGIEDGIVIVYTPHTTAGITINEDADPSVRSDITNFLSKLIPHEAGFSHAEGNSDSHIKSTLTGASETIVIENGRLILGRWQGIYFCEYDGPRSRRVILKAISG
ncbi:MAG: YjbQ family protein [candidate division Zixibacteria bacterium]|nr:YjbQ family protein [candidate division Zixibacteria bacterium]